MSATLLHSLFRHKAWANEELFAELEKLDAATHADERHSAIRLLNHIYVVDRIFAAHLRREPHGYAATNTPETPTLAALRDAVLASDRWYLDYVGAVTAQQLAEPLSFTFTDGAAGGMSREEMLGHVITHGSYHRGAVGRIMSQASVPPPRDTLTVYLHRCEPQRRERA
jgi:uncharacterized damage-inducible protein DinB